MNAFGSRWLSWSGRYRLLPGRIVLHDRADSSSAVHCLWDLLGIAGLRLTLRSRRQPWPGDRLIAGAEHHGVRRDKEQARVVLADGEQFIVEA